MVFNIKKQKKEVNVKIDVQYDVNGNAIISAKYKPSEKEEFMNPVMKEYFRQKLLNMKLDTSEELKKILQDVFDEKNDSSSEGGDEVDRANDETLKQLELSTTENYRLNLQKIDGALKRIKDGTYGYCTITGEPIEIKRLDARPLSSKTLEAQEEADESA